MNDEQKFWITLWFTLGMLVCVLSMVVGATVYNINKVAFENGYEAQTLPGANEPRWVKVRE